MTEKRRRTAPRAPDLPKAPIHLSLASKRLWRAIVDRYDLRPEHLAQLRLALEAVDRCDQARAVLKKDGLMIAGARGGKQRHPAVDVEIASRTAALRAFRQLGLDQYVADERQARDSRGRYG
jgi:phage terminase small subunit